MPERDLASLRDAVERCLEASVRHNESSPGRYWYPLSMATYGVEEIMEALDSMCRFRTTMRDKTLRFEEQFAHYLGCGESVMVNSGSSADLLLSFLLVNPVRPLLNKTDEILVPVVTWPTQIWSAMMAGLKVRFVDVDPRTLNIDLDDLESKVTESTRAIFLAHLMGNPCQMDRILAMAKARGLLIIEDCCEALGAQWGGIKVGNFGVGGSFSFFFSHHITTMEGGMVACPDAETAEQVRILRAHGWLRNVEPSPPLLADRDLDPRYVFVNWGFNLRPTEVQAGFGLHQLSKLPMFNRRRAALADEFFSFIDQSAHLSRPRVHERSEPAWFALPVIVSEDAPFSRTDITSYLETQGVETRGIVTGNVARQPVATVFPEFGHGEFPGADAIHRRGFYLGLSPVQDSSSMHRLLECLRQFLKRY